MDTFQILIFLTILILLIVLFLIVYKNHENFAINPLLFLDKKGTEYDDIDKMRKFRESRRVRNKEYCILEKKPFTKHLKISKMPYVKYVNYPLTRRVSDLLPQYKEHRPHAQY